jgi:hypothetical protein
MGEMAPEVGVDADEFIALSDLVKQSGVHERTVRRHLRRARVEVWSGGWDARYRLIKREDLARLLAPQPISAKAV